jgi:hypothetical protein
LRSEASTAERALSTLGLLLTALPDRQQTGRHPSAPARAHLQRTVAGIQTPGKTRLDPYPQRAPEPGSGRHTGRGIDMNETSNRVPRHLWIVGALSLLWNAVGAFDYSATQFRIESYMSQFTPEQLAYFYGFPAWAVAAWAIAVWSSLLGSLCLLLRKAWAVWLFGIAIVGMALTALYNFVLTDGMAMMGAGEAVFTGVIWLIAISLFFYARARARRGVLR